MSANPANFEERLEVARERFATLVAADTWIGREPAIPVLTEAKGDIAQLITQNLAKLGLAIVVVAADADELKRSGTGFLLRCRIVAQISEKPLLWRATLPPYRPALSAAVRILKAVDRQPNGLDPAGVPHRSGVNEFEVSTDRPFELLKGSADTIYEVSAHTWVQL